MPRIANKIDESAVVKATKKIGGANVLTTRVLTEEPDICIICYDELNGVKKEMCMHEIHTKEGIIMHKFHEICGNQWITSCNKKDITPFCPMCPSVKILYKKKEMSIEKRIKISIDRFERIALTRFRDVSVDCPTLFGIMVCIDNHYIKCYMNYDMMLNANSCLSDIKHFILSESDDIYTCTGPHVPSKVKFNLNYKNWKEWKYPQVRIADAHFAIPPYSNKIGLFNREVLDDNTTLGEMYIRYQTLAGEMYHMHNTAQDLNKALSNIYMDKIVHREYSTGPDDPEYDICAFVNPENPSHLTVYGFNGATHNSVSWISVHLEYE